MSEEELVNYFQEKINNGNNKIFTDISDDEYKTVDAINCIKELQHQRDLYKSVIDNLERWLKEDLGVIYTAESMSGREFTTPKEVAVIEVLKKINELKGVDEK